MIELQAKARTLAKEMRSPDLEGDVFSELYLLSIDHPSFKDLTNKELRTLIAPRIGLAVWFHETNESQMVHKGEEDSEKVLNPILIHSDFTTPETTIIELQEATEEEPEKPIDLSKIKEAFASMNGRTEDIFFMYYFMDMEASEIGETIGLTKMSVFRYLNEEYSDDKMSVFDRPVELEGFTV